jgi:hypothetical protein
VITWMFIEMRTTYRLTTCIPAPMQKNQALLRQMLVNIGVLAQSTRLINVFLFSSAIHDPSNCR